MRPERKPPMKRTARCAKCKKHSVTLDADDIDRELEEALDAAGAERTTEEGRVLCGCTLNNLFSALAEGGWEQVPEELLAEVTTALSRARIPRRVWPSRLMRPDEPMGDPWVASATWVPEWVVRVFEIRVEGVFTRQDGRVWLVPSRLRAILALWNSDRDTVAASMSLYRISGPEAFAAFLLTKGARMTEAEIDEA